MADFTQVNYQGPIKTFRPTVGNSATSEVDSLSNTSYGKGYHDIDYLKGLLDTLLNLASTVYNKCGSVLGDYALVIDSTNADLVTAHDVAYPDDMTPGSITFDEYKYLLAKNTSNAAQYVIAAFETTVRGPGGINALDVSTIALMINNETMRIKEFLDGYIGDVNETAEHRTIELFQDWAENATSIIEGFWQTLTGSITQRLPESELAQLTEETASQSQATIRVKLNTVNKVLSDTISRLSKNWESSSSTFYAKNLGPALQFQIKVAANLSKNVNLKSMPVLGNEINGTLAGLSQNYERAITDQLIRNQLFDQCARLIQMNIVQRDTYDTYLNQLSQTGVSTANKFISSSSIEQSISVTTAASPLSYSDISNDYQTNLYPDHNDLSNLDSYTAHPQYLLRSGGEDSIITGDIWVEDGYRIDGVDLDRHMHTGNDGSSKINGSNIEAGTITEEILDTTSNTPQPYNLVIESEVPLISPIGETTMTVQVSFDVTDSNVSGYEFEIVELT